MRMEDDVGRMRKDGIRKEDGERRMTMMWRGLAQRCRQEGGRRRERNQRMSEWEEEEGEGERMMTEDGRGSGRKDWM